jgi:hypothetical protein
VVASTLNRWQCLTLTLSPWAKKDLQAAFTSLARLVAPGAAESMSIEMRALAPSMTSPYFLTTYSRWRRWAAEDILRPPPSFGLTFTVTYLGAMDLNEKCRSTLW